MTTKPDTKVEAKAEAKTTVVRHPATGQKRTVATSDVKKWTDAGWRK